MPICNKIKELRLQNNLSQEQLANKLDITRRTYIYYETGKKYPSVDLLARISEFFEVSISFLTDEQDDSVANEQSQGNKRWKLKAEKLIEEISGLFARDELSVEEKTVVMEAVQEAYQRATKKNNQA